MKALTFWFDPISPYAHLAFHQLPQALQGLSYSVTYRPVLFAGLLKHWGQLGPAEIQPKREWTYRQVRWLAHRLGIKLELPAEHPFNSLPLLRLLLACAEPGDTPNRWVCERVLAHVWESGGTSAVDPERLHLLRELLQPVQDPDGDAVKLALREATDEAVAKGVFGVPTVVVDGRAFWGLDGLEMLAEYLRGAGWFDSGQWEQAAAARAGVVRR